MKKKKCPSCNQLLPISEFNKDKSKKDGLTFYCRKCTAKKSREYINRWKDHHLLLTEIECTGCHRFLPPSMFNKRKRKKNGLSPICKNCDSIRNKKYREKIKREIERGQRLIKTPIRKECRDCKQVLPSSMFTKDIVSSDGLNIYCKECDHKRQKKYRAKPGSKEKRNRYQKEYKNRSEVKLREKEYQRLYRQKPEFKQWKREYERRPERKQKKKEYNKKYLARPEVKEHIKQYHKEYNSRPEIIKRKKKYRYEYLRRPGVKERRQKYMKMYKQRLKEKQMLKQQGID